MAIVNRRTRTGNWAVFSRKQAVLILRVNGEKCYCNTSRGEFN